MDADVHLSNEERDSVHADDFVESWTQRISTEFRECPGLRLTVAQAARFWGLDQPRVEQILEALVQDAVLVRTPDGAFSRFTEPRRL